VAEHREGFAFAAARITMAASILAIFVGLYPKEFVPTPARPHPLGVRQHTVT
jgi:hypothetical protein